MDICLVGSLGESSITKLAEAGVTFKVQVSDLSEIEEHVSSGVMDKILILPVALVHKETVLSDLESLLYKRNPKTKIVIFNHINLHLDLSEISDDKQGWVDVFLVDKLSLQDIYTKCKETNPKEYVIMPTEVKRPAVSELEDLMSWSETSSSSIKIDTISIEEAQVIGIVSSTPRAGASFLCHNLGIVLGRSGHLVQVIDTDYSLLEYVGKTEAPSSNRLVSSNVVIDSNITWLPNWEPSETELEHIITSTTVLIDLSGFDVVDSLKHQINKLLIVCDPFDSEAEKNAEYLKSAIPDRVSVDILWNKVDSYTQTRLEDKSFFPLLSPEMCAKSFWEKKFLLDLPEAHFSIQEAFKQLAEELIR